MKINQKRRIATDFDEVSLGDVFQYEDDVYMRIDDICNNRNEIFNAVNLSNGDLFFFPRNETVTQVEAELIIE